ncbi:hypothetical protein Z949_1153 [Sulfitobacter guttiformis KCTC 32187]|nr:hypothetical protein Z949_1153 [Sulfitobacter guttiformis KCTC 32187]
MRSPRIISAIILAQGVTAGRIFGNCPPSLALHRGTSYWCGY